MAGQRRALIVASNNYQDPGLQRLRAPAQDAEALAGVLGDPRIGGFDVRTSLDEPAHVISEAVDELFADRARDDLLLVHFSCHGVKDESGELYFAAANTKLRRLGATAVAADFVNRRMNRSRSRKPRSKFERRPPGMPNSPLVGKPSGPASQPSWPHRLKIAPKSPEAEKGGVASRADYSSGCDTSGSSSGRTIT